MPTDEKPTKGKPSRTGTRTEKPWGYEDLLYSSSVFACKLLVINPEQRTSLQYHKKKTEAMSVVRGLARITIDEDQSTIHPPGSCVVIPPRYVHRVESIGIEPLVIFECSTPELDDVVRLEDDYDREVVDWYPGPDTECEYVIVREPKDEQE